MKDPLERWSYGLGGCWVWDGPVNSSGYGTVTVGGRRQMAHRAMFETHRGAIPPGHALDHRCRERRCINPDHLEPVLQAENERRKPTPARLARGEVCGRGHALIGANRLAGAECRTCAATLKKEQIDEQRQRSRQQRHPDQ